MFFAFVVKRLRFLAHVPTLPAVFDAMLLTYTCLFRRRVFRAMTMLEGQALAMFPVQMRAHRFGGTAFCLGGRELAHVHGNGLFDAMLRRAARDELVARARVEPHHVFPDSRWISFWLRDETDVAVALELLRLCIED